MVNCACCSNTRKVIYEDEEITCPVCEDYLGGEQDELEKHEARYNDIQNETNGNGSSVVEEAERCD
jgi:hypothetical protein